MQMGACASKAKPAHNGANGGHAGEKPPRERPAEALQRSAEGDLLHRSSQELSLAHLVRHHRLHPFRRIDQFGLNGCYEVVRLLGRGGTGETYLCKDLRAAGELVAVKLQQRPIPKDTVDMTFNECLVQASACEACVFCTTLREVVITPSHFGLVLELEQGGTVAEEISKRVPKVGTLDLVVSEDEARFLFKQLMAGVAFLHNRHIAHRDIKLDNTLLDGRHPPTIKLADFQFAYYWGQAGAGFRRADHVGTPVYMSPELIQARDRREAHSYDPVGADVWASAVWLLATLVGAFPFDNAAGVDTLTAEQQILRQELSARWQDSRFVEPYLQKLSPGVIDLLSRMLQPDPERRISVSAVLRHSWVTTPLPEALQSAWERLEGEQSAAAARVEALHLDAVAVRARSEALHEIVAAAATAGGRPEQHRRTEGQDESLLRVIDYASIPGGVRLDMRMRAVASDWVAGALAGAALPARTAA